RKLCRSFRLRPTASPPNSVAQALPLSTSLQKQALTSRTAPLHSFYATAAFRDCPQPLIAAQDKSRRLTVSNTPLRLLAPSRKTRLGTSARSSIAIRTARCSSERVILRVAQLHELSRPRHSTICC